MRLHEDCEQYGCLFDMRDARNNGEYTGTEEDFEISERMFYREQQIIHCALVHPHAIATTGVTSHHFDVRFLRFAWLAIDRARELVKPGESVRQADFVSFLLELNQSVFKDGKAESLYDTITIEAPATKPYVLQVLVPELLSKHDVRIWGGRFDQFCRMVDATTDTIALSQSFRIAARTVVSEPEHGSIGISMTDLSNEYDPSDKDTKTIVKLGIDQFDALLGGGHGRGELMVVGGGTSSGKCVKLGTPIILYDGKVVPVEQIRPGDRLMGPDGTPRKVLRTNRGRAPLFEIRPKRLAGDSWYANEDHLLTVVGTGKRGNTCAERRAGRGVTTWGGVVLDVPIKEWLTWSKKRKHNFKMFRPGPIEFGGKKGELPLEPRFLGLMLGNGQLRFTPNLCTPFTPLVAYAKKVVESMGLKMRVQATNRTAPYYPFVSETGPNVLSEKLKSLGLYGTTCDDKFVPQIYKTASIESRLELLAGLIDSDGNQGGGRHYEYSSKSKRLADDTAFVARSLGLYASVKKARKRCQTGAVGTYYFVYISGEGCETVPVMTAHRRLPEVRRRTNPRLVGFDIIPTNMVDDYFGFTLDGDGRFLLGDFTVTHNSYLSQRLMRRQAQLKQRCLYISVEDSEDLMRARFFADYEPSIRPTEIRDKTVDPTALAKAKAKLAAECGDYLIFLDAKKWTVSQICQAIRRHRYLFDIDLVIVDYLQAIQPDEESNNKNTDTALIVSQLKKCAHECGVALVLFSQLTRDAYRNGAEPGLQDCKYSGDIENETEFMVMMWRDDQNVLHAKVVKNKWNKSTQKRYIVHTNPTTGVIELPFEDDFEQPPEQAPRKKYGSGRGGGRGGNGGGP
jgi:replicative DNA helicase